MDLLNAIRSFIKVVEAGSIAAGARQLGVSPAAVSQTMARLERHLQIRLLTRTTRSMALTPAGTQYYRRVRQIERELDLAGQALTTPDSEPQGRLCIASTSSFGRRVLAPLLPAFMAQYPKLSVELLTNDRKVDHARESVDVSLRIAAQLEDHLLARPLLQIPFICCASPGYLARAGYPATPEALREHHCLAFRYPVDGRFLPWGFIRDGVRFQAEFGRVTISDDIDALAQMALHDGGIVRLADFIARPELDAGRLVPLFTSQAPGKAYAHTEPMDIYACVADRFALTLKVRTFMAYLQDTLDSRWPLPT